MPATQYEMLPMSIDDIEEVARIEALSFSQPWSAKSFREMLDGDRGQYIVAKSGQTVIGVCGLLYSFEEAEVSNVGIHPDYRGKGISKPMLEMLIAIGVSKGVKEFSLEVRVSNTPAIHLYKSVGFEIEATRKRCYSMPEEDGYIMWKR